MQSTALNVNTMRILILILTLTISLALPAEEIPLKHLDTVNRLSNNQINSLLRDSDGFLWIGTSAGLYRYDGYSFKNYAPADSTAAIPFAYYIENLQEDADGRIWIFSGRRYSVYDPVTDRITTDIKPLLAGLNIDFNLSYMHLDQSDGMWIHSSGKGLFHLDTKSGNLRKSDDTSFENHDITGIVPTPYGTVTIDNAGVIRVIDPKTLRTITTDSLIADDIDGRNTFVFTLVYDRSGLCWIFNNERLWVYDIANARWLNNLLPADARSHTVKILTQDHSGKLWIGRDHFGLGQIAREDSGFTIRKVSGIEGDSKLNTVTSLYEDDGGTMWIGTYKSGLFYYNPCVRKFNLRKLPDANCILPSAADNSVLVGTDAEGLIRWNPADDSFTRLTSPSIGAITSMMETADGTLYIGSYSSGLKRYRDGKLETLSTGSRIDDNYTWALAEGDHGTLWIGTLGGGLFNLDPQTMKTTRYACSNSGITSDYILKIIHGEKGRLYIATSLGVTIFTPSTGNFSAISELDGISINDIITDSRGLVWIASSDGLKLYDPQRKKLTSLSLGNGDSNPNLILGIQEDRQGDIWVAESGRLICFSIKFDEKTGDFTYTTHRYDSDDGLQKSDFNQRSFALLPSGEMVVGGLYGINSFFPDRIVHNRNLPRVMFSSLYVRGQRVGVGEKIDGKILLKTSPNHGGKLELWPGISSFTITFGTDNHVLPEKTVFSHKLEGLDSDWITSLPGSNSVTYTNLAPGTYRLLVKATNGDGYESPQASELTIVVHPPFWLSTWAKILYVILAAAIIYLIYQLIRRRERRRFNEKRKQDAMQKQEEINQLKFKFYTNVSHELRTPLTLIVSPLESMIKETTDEGQLRRLTLMRNNAQRLLLLVNQLLDFRKNEVAGLTLHLSEGELIDFVRNVCHSFANLSERKNIRLGFVSEISELNMMFDEDKIYKSIMNLLANAFKFTPEGGEVTVTVATTKTTVTISVSDSGIGISDADKQHIFERFYQAGNSPADSSMTGNGIGLSMVSEYVKLHNGSISVSDRQGGGSVFTIELPLIKNSASASPRPAVSETVSAPVIPADEELHEPETTPDAPAGTDGETAGDISGETAIDSSGSDSTADKPIALVVDDSRDMIDFLRDGLSNDFHVITAPDAGHALKLLASIRPSIILTDLMMPEIDGIEFCRRLKSDPAHASTPVIILTAKHDVNAKVEGLTLGADDYVTKPFNMELLLLKMKKLVSLTRRTSRSLIDPDPGNINITPLDEKMVEKAVKYVVTNIKRPDLSVEELSSHLGMSRVHLYKKLKATTGKTPVEFIRLIRLKRGAQMLRESQMNVSEIAFQLGYNNPKYFSKYFKEEFGVLPSVYQDKESKTTNYPV